jgi:heme/copper-type cytochrome/quinol oxidase subunit 2
MAGRRFLLLIALLLGLTAVAASVGPRDRPASSEQGERDTGDAAVTASETRTETMSATEDPQRLVIERGELIALEVSADEQDAVSIPGLGLMDAVAPEAPARFSVLADVPGVYEVELLAADRRIGTLEVQE